MDNNDDGRRGGRHLRPADGSAAFRRIAWAVVGAVVFTVVMYALNPS